MKQSKADVYYQKMGTGQKICGNCTMFQEPNSCTAVQGTISPRAVCDLFKLKKDTKQ